MAEINVFNTVHVERSVNVIYWKIYKCRLSYSQMQSLKVAILISDSTRRYYLHIYWTMAGSFSWIVWCVLSIHTIENKTNLCKYMLFLNGQSPKSCFGQTWDVKLAYQKYKTTIRDRQKSYKKVQNWFKL